eukprot:TRINITY_DN816_c0_g1_i3.p1 TRINITY_DN816_c0_g1~~TRINITY_DN816_c0_g1_i3.p1  ORF type:complete len:508 (+),score=51.25 TRINITY_DN816_c0_g1_i3:172-1695(+)
MAENEDGVLNEGGVSGDSTVTEMIREVDVVAPASDTTEREEWRMVVGRWYVLACFSMLSFCQCMVWFTFSSASTQFEDYYDISESTIDLLLNWGAIIFIPSAFCIWLMQIYLPIQGLRIAFWIGCIANFTGSVVRTIPCWLDKDIRQSDKGVWMLHLGQILSAMSAGVVMTLCTKLSVVWFPTHQRATATAIAYTSNSAGTALLFLLTPAIVSDPEGTPTLLYIQIAFSFIPIVGGLFYFPAQPSKAPSDIAEVNSKTKYQIPVWEMTKRIVTSFSFWLVVFAGGLLGGITSAWQGLLSQVLADDYSDSDIGYMGFANVVAGLIGGLVAGPVVDRFFVRRYKLFLVVVFSAAVALFAFFTLSLKTAYSDNLIPSNLWTLSISITLAGFLQGNLGPVLFELSAELVHPVTEATSGSLLAFILNLATIIMLFVAPEINTGYINTIQTATVVVCLLLVVLVREKYHRLDAEAQIQKQGFLGSQSPINGAVNWSVDAASRDPSMMQLTLGL